jgi:hypothetical protein
MSWCNRKGQAGYPGQSHAAIRLVTKEKNAVIPAGKPESSVQGWQSFQPAKAYIKDLGVRRTTVHGTGFPYPCWNDEIFIFV